MSLRARAAAGIRVIKLGMAATAVAGALLATILITRYGLEDVAAALFSIGILGLAGLILVHVVPLTLCAIAWAVLLPLPAGRTVLLSLWARWIREAVGNLLGILPIAGELVGLRILALHGVPGMLAGASLVVDTTAESLSQVLFTILGLALLLLQHPDGDYWRWILVAAGASAPPLALLAVMRSRRGLGMIERIPQRLAARLQLPWRVNGTTLPDAVHAVLVRPRVFGVAIALHLAAWILATLETWLALHLMDQPVSLSGALAYESIVQALKGVMFFVPWSAGVQEGGYLLMAAVFGVAPEAALALSLIKRARDLMLGVPALVGWQVVEGRRAHRRLRLRMGS